MVEVRQLRQITQTITVGDGSGLPGNCLQAAVASLLDLDLDAVPHFALHDDWLERLVGFAAAHGYTIQYQPATEPISFGLAFGQSPRGVFHAVVLHGDHVWDPHPCRDGLVSVANYVSWTPTGAKQQQQVLDSDRSGMTGHVTIVRNPVPDWKIRVPKRARDLMLHDEVIIDDGADSFPVSRLVIDLRDRTVHAEPLNAHYPARLDVAIDTWLTVLLNPRQVTTPRPCGQRIAAHARKQRGWHADPGGWNVGCGCGWSAGEVVPGNKGDALSVWDVHKASIVNALLAHNDQGHPAARLQNVPGPLDHHPSERKYRLVRKK